MKRLIEEELHADSPERLLADLVRATPRLPDAPLAQRQIWLRVTAPEGAAAAKSGGGRWGTVRTWALAGSAVLLLGAAGWAAMAAHKAHTAAAPTMMASAAPALPSSDRQEPEPPAAATSDVVATESASAAPAATLEPPSVHLRGSAQAIGKRKPGDGEDPTQVLEAIRALRSDGDPNRASALLAAYLGSHPRGVLVEDAMALSIEAATARHDTGAAADLGRRYLRRFPHGRYRAFATHAAEVTSP